MPTTMPIKPPLTVDLPMVLLSASLSLILPFSVLAMMATCCTLPILACFNSLNTRYAVSASFHVASKMFLLMLLLHASVGFGEKTFRHLTSVPSFDTSATFSKADSKPQIACIMLI